MPFRHWQDDFLAWVSMLYSELSWSGAVRSGQWLYVCTWHRLFRARMSFNSSIWRLFTWNMHLLIQIQCPFDYEKTISWHRRVCYGYSEISWSGAVRNGQWLYVCTWHSLSRARILLTCILYNIVNALLAPKKTLSWHGWVCCTLNVHGRGSEKW